MKSVKLLDCTLRDGGYVNNWEFGIENIKTVIHQLTAANIEIIECGFLTLDMHNDNFTLFGNINLIGKYLPDQKNGAMYVAMINCGELDVSNIPLCRETKLDGLRLAFHKKDIVKAIKDCAILIEKGYKLFVQPMVSLSYTDIEFIELIEMVNKQNPFAFYIVDSFGVMNGSDLMRLFTLTDHNLKETISIGYHSHNNLQMAFSNSQQLIQRNSRRNIILDSSIMGMGRGAGNLNTELMTEYLNFFANKEYKVMPLLSTIDTVIAPIYHSHFWGYSLPHYISAKHNCHPNYATYLSEKSTLTVENMEHILSQIQVDQCAYFNKTYIEKLYIDFQSYNIEDNKSMETLSNMLRGKRVLLLAPGTSLLREQERIRAVIDSTENLVTISIHTNITHFSSDIIFASNNKKFDQHALLQKEEQVLLTTSNIVPNSNIERLVVNYFDCLIHDGVQLLDNAGLMLIGLVSKLGVSEILFAGFDGIQVNSASSYFNNEVVIQDSIEAVKKNEMMVKNLKILLKDKTYSFVTTSLYEEGILNNVQV